MKNIVITGGTSGVGYAIAKSLINEDVSIIIIGRQKIKAQRAASRLGDKAFPVTGDLSIPSDRAKVVDEIQTRFKHVDILIHSAGVIPHNKIENINTNLAAHYYLTLALTNQLNNSRILIVTGNPTVIQRFPVNEMQSTPVFKAAWILTHKTLLMLYLAKMFRSVGTTVNSFFPGDVKSDLMSYTRSLSNTSVPVAKHLAIDSAFDEQTGHFYDNWGELVEFDAEYLPEFERDSNGIIEEIVVETPQSFVFLTSLLSNTIIEKWLDGAVLSPTKEFGIRVNDKEDKEDNESENE